jgi:hypothetical protein
MKEKVSQKQQEVKQEREEELARKRILFLTALQEQNDMRSANEIDMFMKVLQFNMDSR